MKSDLNLVVGWLWILLSFITGMVMGMFFRDENWLGGYGSFKRRMYRLAHISLFMLGATNLMFWFTMKYFIPSSIGNMVSLLFVTGAITMPLCCVLMAHFRKAYLLFAIPIISLISGAALTLYLIITGSS